MESELSKLPGLGGMRLLRRALARAERRAAGSAAPISGRSGGLAAVASLSSRPVPTCELVATTTWRMIAFPMRAEPSSSLPGSSSSPVHARRWLRGRRQAAVVTTVSPITNIVQNVGGDRVDGDRDRPRGREQPRVRAGALATRRSLAEADIVFINGLHLEEPTRELAEANVREASRSCQLGDADDHARSSTSTTSRSRRSGGIRTRTCGRTRCTPSGSPRSSATS